MQVTGRKTQVINIQPESMGELPDFQILVGIIWTSVPLLDLCAMSCLNAGKKQKQEVYVLFFVDWRNLPAMADALQMAGWIYRGIIVWNKGNARNIPGRFRQDCEFIVWGTNGQKKVDWTPGFTTFPGCYNEKSVPSKAKHHQTEKPVTLLEKLIAVCPENSYVCDPFMGSGSTGVACVNTKRNFVGIELGSDYFEVAKERIEKAEREALC